MGNWSGKKKPKNKAKRKAKAEKRQERKSEEKLTEREEASSDEDRSSDAGASPARPAPAAASGNILDRARGWWDGLPPQVRIGTMLGVAAVTAVAIYRYFDTMPVGEPVAGKTPIAATATASGEAPATSAPPVESVIDKQA